MALAKTRAAVDPAAQSVSLRPVTRLGSPALAIVETRSIALGYVLADTAVKRATVELMTCRPICPGRFLIAVSGETEAVKQAHRAMLDRAAQETEENAASSSAESEPLSEILIPRLHEAVLPALRGEPPGEGFWALAFIETSCAAAAVLAADAAAKEAPVILREIQLAQGLGGKGLVQLTAELSDLQAAVARGAAVAAERGELVRQTIIARVHPDVVEYL
jgi:microcompartment protein CcmL/EutN